MTAEKKPSEKAISPAGGAIAGGVAGGLAGAALAGPLGLLPGAAAGAVGGVLAGKRAEEELRPSILYADGDLEHLEKVFRALPYHVDGMTWSDYEAAYRFAISEYKRLDEYRTLPDVDNELAHAWMSQRGDSRLSWAQARPAVSHVWDGYDSGIDPYGDIQPAGMLQSS